MKSGTIAQYRAAKRGDDYFDYSIIGDELRLLDARIISSRETDNPIMIISAADNRASEGATIKAALPIIMAWW